MVSILVNDYVSNDNYYLHHTDNDLKKIEDNWYHQDSLLVNLQHTSLFKNRTRWCDLKPIHFNLLIVRNFVHIDNLKHSQRHDCSHPVLQSLMFLILALAKCLYVNSDSNVEFLKINRIKSDVVNFSYQASICLEIIKEEQRELKVVVDNTKIVQD